MHRIIISWFLLLGFLGWQAVSLAQETEVIGEADEVSIDSSEIASQKLEQNTSASPDQYLGEYLGKYQFVAVAEPYLEAHTGPGRGYPIFYVAERGEPVAVLKRRTDWFKVVFKGAGGRDIKGWVAREQMLDTLNVYGESSGEKIDLNEPSIDNFYKRHWEGGFLFGEFGGADVLSAHVAYAFTPNYSVEFSLSKALGSFSDSELASVNLVHQLFPDWRISPYFDLGVGAIKTKPAATIVTVEDRSDELVLVGGGIRGYIARRFIVRLDYKSYVILTSRDDNEEIDQWTAGFNFFF